ncbi:MAG: transposase [Epulopiscium sp.]|nr:transposase [Candidatus Epulonipiscium sp.]
MKTFENWRVEISNYHYYRFTNASVEGDNNKIKALQPRCYFFRNRKSYKYCIYLECNRDLLTA